MTNDEIVKDLQGRIRISQNGHIVTSTQFHHASIQNQVTIMQALSSLLQQSSDREQRIDFAMWYSGMERGKVESAFERYKREVLRSRITAKEKGK